jgi:PKD domain
MDAVPSAVPAPKLAARMRRLLPLLAGILALGLVATAPAEAAWVGAARVDGPAPIVRLGGAAIGSDGTGAVAYVKRIGSKKHHDRDRAGFIARLSAGRFAKPVAIARNAVDDIQVAAGTDGRLAIAWIAQGVAYGLVSGGGAVAAPVELGTGAHPRTLQVRMNARGIAYAVWTQDGAGGADVRAAQLEGTTWTPLGAPLDADPNRSAGTGALRPSVDVAADGSAVAAWGETYPDGSTHVFARRLSGTDAPVLALEANAVVLGTEPGGSADLPQVDAERTGTAAWVAFREDVGTRSRTLARRFGVSFGEPVALDGGATSRNPALAVSGASSGVAAVGAADGTVLGTLIDATGAFAPPVRLDADASTSPVTPVAAWSGDRPAGAVAFRAPTHAGTPVAYGRLAEQGKDFGRLTRISASGSGPVVAGSLRLGADAAANAIVAMLQGDKSGRRVLTAALQDSPPGPPRIAARYYAGPRPRLTWIPGGEAFGAQRFTLSIDGRSAGSSSTAALRVGRTIADGRHTAQVRATDRRKQSTTGPERTIIVDSIAPSAKVTATRSGRVMHVKVRSSDERSGVASVTVRWRDGTVSTSAKRRHSFRHRFAAKGPHRVTVTVRDRAGNRAVRKPKA